MLCCFVGDAQVFICFFWLCFHYLVAVYWKILPCTVLAMCGHSPFLFQRADGSLIWTRGGFEPFTMDIASICVCGVASLAVYHIIYGEYNKQLQMDLVGFPGHRI